MGFSQMIRPVRTRSPWVGSAPQTRRATQVPRLLVVSTTFEALYGGFAYVLLPSRVTIDESRPAVPFAITGVVSDYPGEPDPYNALVEDS